MAAAAELHSKTNRLTLLYEQISLCEVAQCKPAPTSCCDTKATNSWHRKTHCNENIELHRTASTTPPMPRKINICFISMPTRAGCTVRFTSVAGARGPPPKPPQLSTRRTWARHKVIAGLLPKHLDVVDNWPFKPPRSHHQPSCEDLGEHLEDLGRLKMLQESVATAGCRALPKAFADGQKQLCHLCHHVERPSAIAYLAFARSLFDIFTGVCVDHFPTFEVAPLGVLTTHVVSSFLYFGWMAARVAFCTAG